MGSMSSDACPPRTGKGGAIEAAMASRIDSLRGNGDRGGTGPDSIGAAGAGGIGEVDVSKDDLREGGQRGVKVVVSSDGREFCMGVDEGGV